MSDSPQVARWGLVAAGLLLGVCLTVLMAFSPPEIPLLASAGEVRIPAPPASVSVRQLFDGKLQDVNGNDFDLAALRGSTSVLYFASIDNPDSAINGQKLKELVATYPQGSGVQIISLTEDTAPGKPYDQLAVRVHTKVIEATFPMLLDPQASFSRSLQVDSWGQAVVINPAGEVVYRGPLEVNTETGRPRRVVHDAIKQSIESNPSTAVQAAFQQQS